MATESDTTTAEAPVPGQVYVTQPGDWQTGVPAGTAAIFVRTEKRPGDPAPRHLLVLTAGDRVVLERWEDPEVFADRWAATYTPPVDPDEAHGWRRDREALAATLAGVPDAVIGAAPEGLGLEKSAALGRAVVVQLRRDFRRHREGAA